MSAGGIVYRRASFVTVAGGSAASIVAAGIGGLILWAAVAVAHSDPVEGLVALSFWLWSVLFGVLAVVAASFCVRASRSVAVARKRAARLVSVVSLVISCLAVAFYLLGVSLIFA